MRESPCFAGGYQNSSTSIAPTVARRLRTTLGGSVTVILKSSLTDPPLPSLAVTFTGTVPTSVTCGVPEKMRVPAVKDSHVGSAMPSTFVAP